MVCVVCVCVGGGGGGYREPVENGSIQFVEIVYIAGILMCQLICVKQNTTAKCVTDNQTYKVLILFT